MSQPATELPLDSATVLAAEEHEVAIVGRSPWYLAWRRLRRNYVALAALGVFVLILVMCALAPVYAHHVAHTGPTDIHIDDTVKVNGNEVPVISGGSYYDAQTGNYVIKPVKILGPQWWHAGGRYVLGADNFGRDVAVKTARYMEYRGPNWLPAGFSYGAN